MQSKSNLFFSSNTYIEGIALSITTCALFTALMYGLSLLFPVIFQSHYLREQAWILIGLVFCIILFRYFMMVRKQERTGRGILISIFVLTTLFFLFIHDPAN
ncbi:MAG TPA: hypothetical protein VLH16_03715 [Bacteroidales bacterium]|nr:hypothetical protein [Bacteroidales bacterium]